MISGGLVICSVIPYALRTYQGKIKPNVTSWGLWTLIGATLLLTYKSSGRRGQHLARGIRIYKPVSRHLHRTLAERETRNAHQSRLGLFDRLPDLALALVLDARREGPGSVCALSGHTCRWRGSSPYHRLCMEPAKGRAADTLGDVLYRVWSGDIRHNRPYLRELYPSAVYVLGHLCHFGAPDQISAAAKNSAQAVDLENPRRF